MSLMSNFKFTSIFALSESRAKDSPLVARAIGIVRAFR